MSTAIKPLVEAKFAENSQTTQYTAPVGVTGVIDKFTATNTSGSTATITVNMCPPSGTASGANIVTKVKTLQPNEVYSFPELVGHYLAAGGFVSTLASVANAIVIRASGREVAL